MKKSTEILWIILLFIVALSAHPIDSNLYEEKAIKTLYEFTQKYTLNTNEIVDSVQICGSNHYRLLQDALTNNKISYSTQKMIQTELNELKPNFNSFYQYGIFDIFYTTNSANPLDNVNTSVVSEMAIELMEIYQTELNKFKKIKLGNNGRLNIYIYYFTYAGGFTASNDPSITFNASSIKNSCYRKCLISHEMFHRVQFAYNLQDSDTNEIYWVESTARWAEQYLFPNRLYYIDSANDGLQTPNKKLYERDYDAVHFWMYLQHRWKSITENQGKDIKKPFIRLLKGFEKGNRKNDLITYVTNKYFYMSASKFIHHWSITNLMKDISSENIKYNYEAPPSNECGTSYEYQNLQDITSILITSSSYTYSSGNLSMNKYGSYYFKILKLNSIDSNYKLIVNSEDEKNRRQTLIGIRNNETEIIQTSKDAKIKEILDSSFNSWYLIITGNKTESFKIKIKSL